MRVSFAKDPQQGNVLKILEENHYYAFGMKHENYNVTRVDFKRYPDTGVELVPMPAVAGNVSDLVMLLFLVIKTLKINIKL